MSSFIRSITLLGCVSAFCVIAAGCASQQHAAAADYELHRLREENRFLREQMALATGEQMRKLLVAAITTAEQRNDMLPTKPSDLRESLGEHQWSLFLAPYDRSPSVMNAINQSADPWAWVDQHSSFEWQPGHSTFDAHQPVLVEKQRPFSDVRWVFFADGHGEQLPAEQ